MILVDCLVRMWESAGNGPGMMLDQETIRLLDEVCPGWVLEVEYFDVDERNRMAIGEFSHLDVDEMGEWALFLRKRFVGIRLIDVIKIERVK